MEIEFSFYNHFELLPSTSCDFTDQSTSPTSYSNQFPLMEELSYSFIDPASNSSVSLPEQALQMTPISPNYFPYPPNDDYLKVNYNIWYLDYKEAWNQNFPIVKSNNQRTDPITPLGLQPNDVKNSRSYQCDVCSKIFNRKYVLQRHRDSHTDKKDYHCRLCSKSFHRKDIFERHLRTKRCIKAHKSYYGAEFLVSSTTNLSPKIRRQPKAPNNLL